MTGRMFMRLGVLVAVFVIMLAPVAWGAGAPATANVITLKFSHHEPPAARIAIAFQKWADMVGEKTNGRVKIQIFPAQTLGKGADSYSMVQSGIADMAWLMLGFFPGQFPLSEAYNLPMLGVPSGKAGASALWDYYQGSPAVQKEWTSVKVVTTFSSGVQFVNTAKKPVRTLQDIKGQKIRVTGWGTTNFIKSLGGNPIGMSPPEMYDGISKGVIDGMVFDWQGIQSSRLYEVLSYATYTPLVQVPQFLALNLDRWKSFPPDIQKVFEEMGGKFGAQMLGGAFDEADPVGEENFKKL
ncbi:MAG TPA: TRAP transporter substrate-binding protein, partial [Candidatus Acidoferrum sp.]|nr:TRAP transporter substrate-binding protein [Candidatus Acidoferrum sp.]